MINPIFKDTITLYHQTKSTENGKTVTRWTRSVFTDCFFDEQIGESLSDKTLSVANSYIVRIPYISSAIEIIPGDIIVQGKVVDAIEDVPSKRANDILAKYRPNAFTVTAVSNNTKIPQGAHYKVVGV